MEKQQNIDRQKKEILSGLSAFEVNERREAGKGETRQE